MWCSGNFKGIVCFLIADTDKDYDNNSSSCNEQSALLTSEHLPMCQKSLDFGSQGTKTTLLFNTLDIEDADVARQWQILYNELMTQDKQKIKGFQFWLLHNSNKGGSSVFKLETNIYCFEYQNLFDFDNTLS